jgi:hypothetical protein
VGNNAVSRGVQVYALGVGDILQTDLSQIQQVTQMTSGTYYCAENVDILQTRLLELIRDLTGQYVASYVTLRSAGSYDVQFVVNILGIVGALNATTGDVSKFKGNDLVGKITFDPPTIDLAQRKATMFMRALHIPRGVTRIRFRLDTPKPLQIDIVGKEDRGLLDGWTLTGPDNGYYTVESAPDRPLAFGNFGPLFRVEVGDVTEPSLAIPLIVDSTIYGQTGKSFDVVAPPKPVGTPTPTPTPTPTRTPTPTPTPTPGPVQMGLNDVRFTWESQTGPQIAVPQGTLVKVFVTLTSATVNEGTVEVTVMRYRGSTLAPLAARQCPLNIAIPAGPVGPIEICEFMADALTGSGGFVHYYVQVRWNGALIYDPSDPATRPFVETF